MPVIIGQDRIINLINSYTFNTLPKALIIDGLKGSGRHSIVQLIADKFHLQLQTITGVAGLESFYSTVVETLYLIDTDNFIERDYQELLKILEEPPKNCSFILLSSPGQMIPVTVQNRCIKWGLDTYSKDTLTHFTSDPLILQLSKTPGDIKILENVDLVGLSTLCSKIYDKISNANPSNILTISDKIAFKDKDSGFNAEAFVKVLNYVITDLLTSQPTSLHIQYWRLTQSLISDWYIPHINRKLLLNSFLLDLKYINNGY